MHTLKHDHNSYFANNHGHEMKVAVVKASNEANDGNLI